MYFVATNDAGGLYYRTNSGSFGMTTSNWANGGITDELKPGQLVLVFKSESDVLNFLAALVPKGMPGANTNVTELTDELQIGPEVYYADRHETGAFHYCSGMLR